MMLFSSSLSPQMLFAPGPNSKNPAVNCCACNPTPLTDPGALFRVAFTPAPGVFHTA